MHRRVALRRDRPVAVGVQVVFPDLVSPAVIVIGHRRHAVRSRLELPLFVVIRYRHDLPLVVKAPVGAGNARHLEDGVALRQHDRRVARLRKRGKRGLLVAGKDVVHVLLSRHPHRLCDVRRVRREQLAQLVHVAAVGHDDVRDLPQVDGACGDGRDAHVLAVPAFDLIDDLEDLGGHLFRVLRPGQPRLPIDVMPGKGDGRAQQPRHRQLHPGPPDAHQHRHAHGDDVHQRHEGKQAHKVGAVEYPRQLQARYAQGIE